MAGHRRGHGELTLPAGEGVGGSRRVAVLRLFEGRRGGGGGGECRDGGGNLLYTAYTAYFVLVSELTFKFLVFSTRVK